jgi:hypothetical protein
LTDGFSWDAFAAPAMMARYLTGRDIPVENCFLVGNRLWYWERDTEELVLAVREEDGCGPPTAFWEYLRNIGSAFDSVEAAQAEVERRGLSKTKPG